MLFISFFIPWLGFLGKEACGFEIYKIWDPGKYLWAIPLAAVVAIALESRGHRFLLTAQIAGALPLVFLVIALNQFGSDLFRALSAGSYLTLASGLLLLCAPLLNPQASDLPTESQQSALSKCDETEVSR